MGASETAVFAAIKQFFPRGCSFNSALYQESEKHKNLLALRARYLKDMSRRLQWRASIMDFFDRCPVVDWTNEDDGNCFEFTVLLHPSQPILDDDTELMQILGGRRTDLRLFISIIGPFYYWFIEASSYDQSTGQWSFATTELSPSSQLNGSLERTLDNLSLKGYEEVPRRIARMVVPNVETELKETGAVSVFDCLFTDLVSIAD